MAVTNSLPLTSHQTTNWPVIVEAPSEFKPWPFWLLLVLALLFLVYVEIRRRLKSDVRKLRVLRNGKVSVVRKEESVAATFAKDDD